jgi:hypothetical protein
LLRILAQQPHVQLGQLRWQFRVKLARRLAIVIELGQLPHQDHEDVLYQVVGVGVAQTEAPGPVVEQGGVEVDEALPGLLFGRLSQALQQAGRRGVHARSSRRGS